MQAKATDDGVIGAECGTNSLDLQQPLLSR